MPSLRCLLFINSIFIFNFFSVVKLMIFVESHMKCHRKNWNVKVLCVPPVDHSGKLEVYVKRNVCKHY